MSFIRRLSRGLYALSNYNVTGLSKCYHYQSLHTDILSASVHRRLSLTHCSKCSYHQSRNMHLLQFRHAGKQHIGVKVDGNKIVSVTDFVPELPNNVCAALRQGPEKLTEAAKRCLESSQAQISVEDVEMLPPITNPDKVVCIGLNYRDHAAEVGKDIPSEPLVFSKFSSSIYRSGDFPIPPVTKCLDYECEMVIVVGKKARDVSEADAMDYVFGYTAANDVSARDLVSDTKNGGQFLLAKSLDNFCPLADQIVTKDAVGDIHNLNISTTVNGEFRQRSNTNQIIFTVPKLIQYLSSLFTLLPGDIILTGTPGGVAMGMKPPKYLKSGDTVVVTIENIGTVTNKFV